MNNLNIKKFPDGFNVLPNNSDGEYLIISRKGDKKPFKISIEKLAALLGLEAGDIQRIKAVSAGPLPTPDSANKYMVVTDVGTWTYGGVDVGTNADGYQTTFWWDGTTWSNNGSVRVKGDAVVPDGEVKDGDNRAVNGSEVFKSVQIKDKIKNIIKNGSFISDDNWLTNNATKVFTTGSLEITPTAAPTNTTTVQHLYQSVTLDTTHKYYVAFEIRGEYNLRIMFSSQTINTYYSKDNYNYLDSIFTPSSGVERAIGLRDLNPTSIPFFVKKAILVDLTDIYGSGKEPSVEEFRDLVKNIVWDSDIKVVKSNDDIIKNFKNFENNRDKYLLKINNSVVNGDFESGVFREAIVNYKRWNTYTGISNFNLTDNGILGTKSATLKTNASITQRIYNEVGDKLYISANVRFKSGIPTNNGCYVRIMANNTIKQSFSVSGIKVDDVYNHISFITEPLVDVDSVVAIYVTGDSEFTIDVDSVVVINITKDFKDVVVVPTKDEIDNFVKLQHNYYFNSEYFINLNDFRNRINTLEKSVKEANLKNYSERFFISDSIRGYFTALDRTYVNHSSDFENLKYTDIYSWFDSLTSENTGYATKNVLNTVTTPDGEQPINIYSFKPPVDNTLPIKFPVIFIIAGAHGNEKQPPIACYNLMKDICENWKENDFLKFLRFNCEIKIIPCLNMYGFDRNTRKNYNGVDINRNYSYGWYLQDISSVTYGGTNAFSEIESQTVRDFLLSNKVDILIDFHNFSNNGVDNYIWTQSPVDKLNKITSNVIRNLTAKWKKEHPTVSQSNVGVFGYTEKTSSIYGSVEQYAFFTLGIPSTLLEVDQEFTPLAGDLGYSVLSQKTAEETVCNMLVYFTNHIDS